VPCIHAHLPVAYFFNIMHEKADNQVLWFRCDVDLGDEQRQGVEPRFDLTPVVVGAPVFDKRAELRKLHAL
jgi:hypothetical protein